MIKRATLEDVAKQSGVSTATVSRAVSNSPLVTKELKAKVLQVARQIGYRPKSAPKRAIVQPSPQQPHLEVVAFCKGKVEGYPAGTFTSQVLHGIQTEALHLHNAKVSMRSYSQPRFDADSLNELSQRDGMILVGGIDRYPGCLDQILEMDIPVVVAGRQVPGKTLNCVNTESYPACRDLTDYLFNMGFRRFGWLGVQGSAQHFEDRLDMIRGRLVAKGVNILPGDCRLSKNSNPKEVLELMDQWVEEGDLPEIIICSSGSLVVYVQRSLASHGLGCPEDLSIACFNNYNYPDIFHPEPTRMATFPDEIGRRAHRRLLELVQNPRERNRPEVILIPMQFIEGDSVLPPKRAATSQGGHT